MRRTRWKLAAGAVGLSLGGLAAIADVPTRTGMVSCAAPPVVQVPDAPAPAPLPPPVQPAPALPILPPVAAGNVATPADLPTIPPAPPTIILVRSVEAAPMPRPAAQVFDLPMPAVPVDAAPAPSELPPVVPPIPAVQGTQAPRLEPLPATPAVADTAPPPVIPAVSPQAPPVELAPAAPERKLKVMLHMGDDRPRFEVRDGEEVYLKVLCEKVDVKSPSDRGETMSVLRATGKVSFMTPGGEGMCDELSVVPGTGQVIVSGKVEFKYNWGKVETTVSGERMTFRLGSAPGMAPPSTPAAVPASYNRPR